LNCQQQYFFFFVLFVKSADRGPLFDSFQAKIAISRTHGRGAVVAAGMDAVKVHLFNCPCRLGPGLMPFAANFQESEGARWTRVSTCVIEAAKREREGSQPLSPFFFF
jgi:hypothetical protein